MPRGLPENFFQGTAQGLYLRREVSTYISPLGIAYTGLLIVPLAAAFSASRVNTPRNRALILSLFLLLMTGILFSITRLAIALMVGGVVMLTLLLRRPWLIGASALAAAGALAILYGYPRVGPLVDALREIASKHGATPAQVALAWLIRKPNVVAIPGASSVRQLEENVAAADIDLTDDESQRLGSLAPVG